MRTLAVIVPALLAAACAGHRSELAFVIAETAPASPGAGAAVIAAAEEAAVTATSPPEDIKIVEINELEDEPICESNRRTGTRISTRPICYSREEYAAIQAAKQQRARVYLDQLAREQDMLAIQEQAADEQRRRSMIGSGR